jgi:diguanylate cyclase (GGDEF)-like protein
MDDITRRPLPPDSWPASFPDERLSVYASAVRAMRQGRFGVAIPADGADDPLNRLGRELNDLAGWLDRRFAEFIRIRKVAEHVAGGVRVDDTLDRVYESFHALIPFNRIGCALLNEDGNAVKAHWARSDRPQKLLCGFTAPLAGSSLESILQTGQPRILNDLEAHLAERPGSVSTRLMLEEGIRSSLTCPLVAQGRPVGFLFFSSVEKNAYRDVHQDVFVHIAGQLSALIEKSRLYQQVIDLNNDLLAAQESLRLQATRDALTGIYNRRAILEFAEAELQRASRHGSPMALVLTDVDHFKMTNDLNGHMAGDAVLRAVAAALAGNLRAYDRVGRYGGEEFLVVIVESDAEAVMMTVERLRLAVAALQVNHEEKMLSATASFGIALRGADSVFDMNALLAIADEGLYEAKRLGRNRCVLHMV